MAKNQAGFVLICSLIVFILFLPGYAALSATDCVSEPKPSTSGHWYYHVDPVTKRKCWYIAGTEEARQSSPTIQTFSASKGPTALAAPLQQNSTVAKLIRQQGQQNTVSHSAADAKREADTAARFADCQLQSLKVYDEEKQTFMKECFGAKER